MLGTSYDGLLTLLALKKRHPALVAVAPFASPVDYWLYDDIAHLGAFRFVHFSTCIAFDSFGLWSDLPRLLIM